MKGITRSSSGKRRPAKPTAPYDVVALVASAGGNGAIRTVLQALPASFPVPVVVMQHFPPDMAEPPRSYGQSLPFELEWARAGARLAPGRILVAPPKSFFEILPDGTCAITPCQDGARARPIDRFLRSLARSFAHRAIGVVLSGMMDDGAEGARQLRDAGGAVIAQSEADYGEMLRAAVRNGGADVALPVEKVGALLVDLACGATVLRPLSELQAVEALFPGEGRASAELRAVNWTATALGPVREWSPALTTAVRLVMGSTFPSCIYWGPELVQIYNQAFVPLLEGKAAPAGKPARITWPELWTSSGARLESILRTGKAIFAEDQLVQGERHGHPEETYLTWCESPLFETDGTVSGVLVTANDTTGRVRASRRLKVLRDLSAIRTGESALLVAEQAAKVLGNAPLDVPFVLFYLFDRGRKTASLAAAAGVDAGTLAAPYSLTLSEDDLVWPLGEIARSGSPSTVNDLIARLPDVKIGPWTETPSSARLFPLWNGVGGQIAGVAVTGLSSRLPFDPAYQEFLQVICQYVSAALGESEVRRLERERSQRLTDLDRAKVDFFSNVSHEFRTPLTLLLGPLEELLGRQGSLPADLAGPVDAAVRNGRRLLGLVNDLLDFSQSETHREQARLEPTDLGALTSDIASAFRSAIETAGLEFEVRCERHMRAVWVDRQMWERIISNLLSNAFKFTFKGKVRVALRAMSLHVELVIKDTGVGIPEAELPNLFKRFHRVRGTRARTMEGSGIGLWMVDDLVKRVGGQLRVRSKLNVGTTFTIWVPYQSVRPATEPAETDPTFRPTEFASEMALQVSRWIAEGQPGERAPSGVLDDVFGPPPESPASSVVEPTAGRILVVDDNADMREYLQRLLSGRWRIDTASDGFRAFDAALALRPDVIVADVMMPGLDGFELLKRIRAHQELQYTPVVLVTARAGEEAAIQGLRAGATDYIAKPFSPRELVARVQAAVDRARAEATLRASEAHLASELEDARVLQKISNELVSEGGHNGHYDHIVEAARTVMRSDAASIQELEAAEPRLKLLAHTGFHPESAAFWAYVDADVGTSCGRALTAQTRVVVPDMDKFDADPHDVAAYRKSGIMSVQSTPLVASSGRIVGMMSTHWHRPHAPSAEGYRFFDILARLAADFMERARTKAALRESEEKYRTLFETMGQGYSDIEMIHGPDGRPIDHRLIALNPAFERLTGIRVADAIGRTAREVTPGMDPWWFETYDRIVHQGYPERVEYELAALGRCYEAHCFPQGGERLTVLYEDITERKRAEAAALERARAEAAIRESEGGLRAAVEDRDALLKELHHRVKNNSR